MTVMTEIVDIDGIRLRVHVQGRGQPLLLLTGIGVNLETWSLLIPELRGFETIAFDLPGIGESPPRWPPLTMGGLARLCARVLTTLGFTKVDVLGVSFGGCLAQQLAHEAPMVVNRLILAATGVGIGGVPGNPLALAALLTPQRHGSRDYMDRVAKRLYGDDVDRQRERFARFVAHTRAPTWSGYASMLVAVTGWSSLPWIRSLTPPTLVLAGSQDRITPAVNGRMLARLIPNARLEVIEGGHLFLLLNPEQSLPLIRGFLQPPTPRRRTRTSACG
jgi:poly(3-hydroxyoctanoate) depolymerase